VPAGFADGSDDIDDTVSWSEIQAIVGAGSTQVAQGNHAHSDVWVNVTGDTMTGPLTVTALQPTVRLNTSGTQADLLIQEDGGNRWSLGWNAGSKYLYLYDWAAPGGTRLVVEDDTGNLGLGTASPANRLDVAGPGSATGGVAGFNEVVARCMQTGAGHSAVSIDSADLGLAADPGQDPILYFAAGGQAIWDIRVDDSDYDLGTATVEGMFTFCDPGWRDTLEIRYQVDGVNYTAFQLRPRHYYHPECQSLPDFEGVDLRVNGNTLPVADNEYRLGKDGARWREVWASNPLIQTSDLRLKERITPIPYGLDAVSRLHPVSFTWHDSNDRRTYLGLIAQEVEPLIPEAVRRGATADQPWSMTYSSLIPVLIQAIQDQQAIIVELGARIDALENGG
jgi:hypothetical protein